MLDDVPVALPALTRAVKLQSRAARVGFDWPSLVPVLAKIEEEIAELKSAIADEKREKREAGAPASKEVTEEFGDLLFVMANVARHLGVDPEASLARRQREIRAPVSQHRGSAPRRGPQARRLDAGRDGSALGRGQGRGAEIARLAAANDGDYFA